MTNETIEVDGHTLYRIQCIEDFYIIKKGDLGGFIEGYENLKEDAWVYSSAKVYGKAVVKGNAIVGDSATVCNKAQVLDYAYVFGNAYISGYTVISGCALVDGRVTVYGQQYHDKIFGHKTLTICGESIIKDNALISNKGNLTINNATIYGNAVVHSDYDYITFKNWWSSGRLFTWTRSNDMWSVGCFYGTGKELIAKAYKDSQISGREYKRIVKYVEEIKKTDKQTIWQKLKNVFRW